MSRGQSVPEWTLHDGTDEHEDCDDAPCRDCRTAEAATPDPKEA